MLRWWRIAWREYSHICAADRPHTCLRLAHIVCTLSHASACPRDRIWAHSAEDGTEDSRSYTDGTAAKLARTWTKSSTCTGGPSDVRGSVAMTPVPRPAYAAVHMADKEVSALMHSGSLLVGGSALAQARRWQRPTQVAGSIPGSRRQAAGGRWQVARADGQDITLARTGIAGRPREADEPAQFPVTPVERAQTAREGRFRRLCGHGAYSTSAASYPSPLHRARLRQACSAPRTCRLLSSCKLSAQLIDDFCLLLFLDSPANKKKEKVV